MLRADEIYSILNRKISSGGGGGDITDVLNQIEKIKKDVDNLNKKAIFQDEIDFENQ